MGRGGPRWTSGRWVLLIMRVMRILMRVLTLAEAQTQARSGSAWATPASALIRGGPTPHTLPLRNRNSASTPTPTLPPWVRKRASGPALVGTALPCRPRTRTLVLGTRITSTRRDRGRSRRSACFGHGGRCRWGCMCIQGRRFRMCLRVLGRGTFRRRRRARSRVRNRAKIRMGRMGGRRMAM
ncbi:hypothetical protein B0H16DRAFT_1534207 [Mycena metata]|uniref:Secreted protein n=1 Tax=Mycena metata TaxID=1033252 RepID=A0AAD7J8F8_9AGAR|nr:hypothetical protein B0H16DRAFT_1534207 [Mycena metata]